MDAWYTASRPSSRACADGAGGFSIVELLVALVVAAALTAGVMTIAVSSRSGYATDRERTHLNQNLRSALDLMGIEIRQSGERLPFDFPAIEVVDGTAGAPDTLVLRRNLLDAVLPLCETLTAGAGATEVRIADSGGTPAPGCTPLPDDDGSGWPDNLDIWRAWRGAAAVPAYIFNPVADTGEWIVFDGDGSTTDFLGRAAGPWAFDYDVAQQCRIYALEERRYSLVDGTLRILMNGDAASPIHMSADLVDFQVTVVLDDGSVAASLGPGDDWTRLRGIDVTVRGAGEVEGRTLTREASARFFPRNVLSN